MADHYCEYITGAQNDPINGIVTAHCDAPASIKRNGIWLCAEHYDMIEEDLDHPICSAVISDKDEDLFEHGAFEKGLYKNLAFSIMYGRQ